MRKLFAIVLCLVMVLGLAACSVPGAQGPSEAATDATAIAGSTGETTGMKKITVTVVHGDGSTKEFTYETNEEFVGPVLVEAGLIKGNDGPYGLEITEVDGEAAVYATDKAYWAVYEGAEYALQGIDTTPAVDGGTYKLEYTRG